MRISDWSSDVCSSDLASFIAADASWQRKVLPVNLPDASCATRPVREWLADQARVPAQLPGTNKGFPGVSRTDPAAAWSARTVRGRFGTALDVPIDHPSGDARTRQSQPEIGRAPGRDRVGNDESTAGGER